MKYNSLHYHTGKVKLNYGGLSINIQLQFDWCYLEVITGNLYHLIYNILMFLVCKNCPANEHNVYLLTSWIKVISWRNPWLSEQQLSKQQKDTGNNLSNGWMNLTLSYLIAGIPISNNQ